MQTAMRKQIAVMRFSLSILAVMSISLSIYSKFRWIVLCLFSAGCCCW